MGGADEAAAAQQFWDVAGWHLTHKADKAQLVTSMRPVVAMMVLLAATADTTERWTTVWRCNPGNGSGVGRKPLQSSQGESKRKKGRKMHAASKCETGAVSQVRVCILQSAHLKGSYIIMLH